MPELPEVEAVTRKLRTAAVGARIVEFGTYRAQMVRPQTVEQICKETQGRTVEACLRRGKQILVRLSGGLVARVHLRMTGNLVVIPDRRLRPETARVWFDFEDGRAMVLDDPRALGRLSVHRTEELEAIFARLGPEPLWEEFTAEHLIAQARKTAKPMKTFLMDQKAVVGLGNIYAAEALFQARVHPAREARRVSEGRMRVLHDRIVAVLRVALDSAIAAYTQPSGFEEGEFFPVAVYGREGEPCPECGSRVKRIPQGGRSTYYCPSCQR